MASTRQVPFFNYRALFESQEAEITAAVTDVMRRGAYILQSDLTEFEAKLAGYLGVKYAYGVADGTNALIIALRAAGIGAGDELIVPSHTYVASAASIHIAGATPEDDMNRHERRKAERLERKQYSPKAGGAPVGIEDLERLLGGKENLPLTEDLIKELVRDKGMKESDVRDAAAMGALYCPPRNSFIFPSEDF